MLNYLSSFSAKSNLPHFTGRRPKNINAADLLKTHITGVINHGHGGFSTFVDINEYPHDPNLTINILLLAMKRTAEMHGNHLPPVCYIQADNCYRENKNKYVLAFCELLVAEHIFHEVHLSFLYVGHTHEDVDAAFSRVAETLRTTDVETMPDLMRLLPNPRDVSFVFDVKSWLSPEINDIEKHSEPLHFKFINKMGAAQMYFKGQHSDSWCELDGNVLKSIPNGEPNIVKPDYSNINTERLLKQIDLVKTMFRKSESINKWKSFYNNLIERHIDKPTWILKELPRQQTYTRPIMDTVPPEIRELIQKEIQVPQVRIKKRKQQTNGERDSTNSKKKTASGKSKRGQQRHQVLASQTTLIIQITDDVKRHIWLIIFMELFDTFMIMLLLCLIIMYYFRLLCLLQALNDLMLLFESLIALHIGKFAHVSSFVFGETTDLYQSLMTVIPAIH